MASIVNHGLPLWQVLVYHPVVSTFDSSSMQLAGSMAERIAEVTRGDSLRDVAAKVQMHGGSASHTAVQKWLNGGNIDEQNLVALCAAYNVSPAYVRYGVGPRDALNEKQQAAAELVDDDPPEWVQKGFDFMRYSIARSPLDDPEAMAHYMKLLDTLIGAKKE